MPGEAFQFSPPERDFVRVAGDFNPRRACRLDMPIPVAITPCSCSRSKVGSAPNEGLLRREHRDMLLVDDDAGRLLDRMERYVGPVVPALLKPEQV